MNTPNNTTRANRLTEAEWLLRESLSLCTSSKHPAAAGMARRIVEYFDSQRRDCPECGRLYENDDGEYLHATGCERAAIRENVK